MQGERHAGMPQSVLLLLGSCLPVLGAVLLAPVLPRMQLHFTETPGATVLVPVALTLPALMVAVLAPFAGIFADRVGRKPLLLWAMLMYMVCGTVPLWLDSLQAIVLSRAGIGLAEAAIMTCCTTLMGDYYSGGRRERLFALQMVATSLSAALFMAVGGQMGQDSWRAPFALYSVGLVFLPLMAWWLWEPQRTLSTRTDDKHLPWRRTIASVGIISAGGNESVHCACAGRLFTESVGRGWATADRDDYGWQSVRRSGWRLQFSPGWSYPAFVALAAGFCAGRQWRVNDGGGGHTRDGFVGGVHQWSGHWPDAPHPDYPDHGPSRFQPARTGQRPAHFGDFRR